MSDGSQLEGAHVISAGRGGLPPCWLEVAGADVFIDKANVVGVAKVDSVRAA
jgi:hypothetical protein